MLVGFGFLTVVLAGWVSLLEVDLKKVVAFSTLSHMGLLMVVAGCGLHSLCLFHVLCHAVFKSGLFLLVGVVLHSSFSEQRFARLRGVSGVSLLVVGGCGVCLSSLCGLFFFSGGFSKDFLLERLSEGLGRFGWLVVWVSMVLRFLYSFKVFGALCSGVGGCMIFPPSSLRVVLCMGCGLVAAICGGCILVGIVVVPEVGCWRDKGVLVRLVVFSMI